MKSFQKFIVLALSLFVVAGIFTLSIGKSFFNQFTLDVFGLLAIIQFIFPALVYVYVYEKILEINNFHLEKTRLQEWVFVGTWFFLIVISTIFHLLITYCITNKIDFPKVENIVVVWIGYIFLYLNLAERNRKIIYLFKIDKKPIYYIKNFLLIFLFYIPCLILIAIAKVHTFEPILLFLLFNLILQSFLFVIPTTLISFFLWFCISKIPFFRKSTLALFFLLPIISFGIVRSFGFYLDFFSFYINDFFLFMVTSGTSWRILKFKIDNEINDFKINKLTSDFSKKEAEYLQLKQQVNPHFLFNNLNTLISFIEINPKKAIEFGHHLSNTYRHYLKNKNDDFVSLKEELEFIKEYLEIYKAKFENSFTFEIAFEPKENEYIVCLSLQEIVDNVFKHNTMDENNPLEIRISSIENRLIIENTITNKMESESNQIGLENINKRYKILTNKEIQIVNNTDSYQVILPILELEN